MSRFQYQAIAEPIFVPTQNLVVAFFGIGSMSAGISAGTVPAALAMSTVSSTFVTKGKTFHYQAIAAPIFTPAPSISVSFSGVGTMSVNLGGTTVQPFTRPFTRSFTRPFTRILPK